MPLPAVPRAVFFDLDGTLVDSAGDLAAAVNSLRVDAGLEPMPVAALRPFASMGARGMIGAALGVTPDQARFAKLRDEFLRRYEAGIVVHTRLFDGMDDVLQRIERKGWRWGIVSNKAERYVRIIATELGLAARSVATVGGDTTPHPKPHPAPLLLAAGEAGIDARHCVYVGDDLRDIEAGHAAGMMTVVAAYGYCGADANPASWGADALAATTGDLITVLGLS